MIAPRVLIAAGGTGGHVFPALAVAKALQGNGWHAEWVGSDRGLEQRVVPAAGIGLHLLKFSGVRGKGITAWLSLPIRLVNALTDAAQVFARAKPELVMAFGGYVTFPIGLIARWRRIPLCIHEQNAVMGTANRWLARIANRVLLSFPKTRFAPATALLIGNPVRQSILALSACEERYANRQGPLRILVVGGSLGARALNQLLPAAFAGAIGKGALIEIRHQTGAADLDTVKQAYQTEKIQAQCQAFIDDMDKAYEWADLLICRAGASTVTEVAAAGVAALFVPLPSAIDDHQTANARYLSDQEAAWLMPQSGLNAASLAQFIAGLDRPAAAQRAAKAHGLAMGNATALALQHAQMLLQTKAQEEGRP
jgi:UDP-N-acetylglucosamine--N-acetylmuramyl-(pentapeptide) pyrophosphoryl-undecaprenol N-acetylglucosamine transferase